MCGWMCACARVCVEKREKVRDMDSKKIRERREKDRMRERERESDGFGRGVIRLSRWRNCERRLLSVGCETWN